MTTAGEERGSDERALRAEHDELAQRLAALRSVEQLRTAAYAGFATFISFLLALKFAWDRWGWSKLPKPPPRGRYPILPILGLLLFLVLLGFTTAALRRARRHRAEESLQIARFEELRRRLGLDP